MLKYLVTAAAVAALSSTAPASAQVGGIFQQGILGSLFGGGGVNSRIDALDRQIRISFQRGEISQTEANRLQNRLLEISQLNQSYRVDGLSRSERLELQERLDRLERRIQLARNDRDGRWDDDDDDDRFRNGCPPGLAKKNNGCLPPGQAKKMGDDRFDRYGDRRFEDTDRYVFRRDGDRILQIDRRTGRVVRVIRR